MTLVRKARGFNPLSWFFSICLKLKCCFSVSHPGDDAINNLLQAKYALYKQAMYFLKKGNRGTHENHPQMFYPLLLLLSGMVLLGFVPYMLNKINFSFMIYKISYHFSDRRRKCIENKPVADAFVCILGQQIQDGSISEEQKGLPDKSFHCNRNQISPSTFHYETLSFCMCTI